MPTRQYTVRFFASMAAYTAVLFGSVTILSAHPQLPRWQAAVVGLAPMVPLLFTLTISVAAFRALDELERRTQSEGLMISFAATAVIVLSYGFLESSIDAPKLNTIWVWAVQGFTWLAGVAIAKRRYQ